MSPPEVICAGEHLIPLRGETFELWAWFTLISLLRLSSVEMCLTKQMQMVRSVSRGSWCTEKHDETESVHQLSPQLYNRQLACGFTLPQLSQGITINISSSLSLRRLYLCSYLTNNILESVCFLNPYQSFKRLLEMEIFVSGILEFLSMLP